MSFLSDFILLGLVNVLVIVGFHMAVQFEYEKFAGGDWELRKEFWTAKSETKNILWFVKYYSRNLPVWIQKPLYDCPRCMASLHSTYIYFTLGTLFIAPQMQWNYFVCLYPVYILMLSGIVEIITRKFDI